jgi:hypothetical protein
MQRFMMLTDWARARSTDFCWAAAETPGGAHDFGGEGFFYGSGGREFRPEIGTDFRVGFGFVFADEIADGEEAEG